MTFGTEKTGVWGQSAGQGSSEFWSRSRSFLMHLGKTTSRHCIGVDDGNGNGLGGSWICSELPVRGKGSNSWGP